MTAIKPNCYHELVAFATVQNNISKLKSFIPSEQLGIKGVPLLSEATFFYIVDYAHQSYLYIDPLCERVLGWDAAFLSERGPEHYMSLWHPDDFRVYNEKVFPETISFLRKHTTESYPNFSFSHNYRIKNKIGSYITVLQRSTFYSEAYDPELLAAIGFVVDISNFKDDTNMVHVIENADKNVCRLSQAPLHKSIHSSYSVLPQVGKMLSKREIEILQAIYDGLSSKEIAEKYFISVNTVNNHRKNMLHKTNTCNCSELLRYALNHGLLLSNLTYQ